MPKDLPESAAPATAAGRNRRRLRRLLSRELSPGCLAVHADYGIGRFEGVELVEAAGAAHACFRLVYDKGDRLFVPVENADLVSWYGAEDDDAPLDRLGGGAWEQRKQGFRDRLRQIAEDLVRAAAERRLARPEPITPPPDYAAFNARFPYELTEDQARAVADVEADLRSGALMDRLVCGDVGFGKTEIALRAACLVAMAGRQVAVIAPTTPLCRQHFEEFGERFAGFGVEVVELSRAVPAKEAAAVRKALRSGAARVVIGTHALLGKAVRFADLGLLVIDEEQRFGVRQKEQLRNAAARVHVLTMTATPIPRTLQLSLAGFREVSIIATPPKDRKPVETTVLAFDAEAVGEALRRERERGGQSFYVCPRLSDLPGLRERLAAMLPDASVVVAHGRMKADELDAAMTKFVRRGGDVLLATNIVESGLNIPNANTLVVHRADMFGMAQLHQLRGRVGRSPRQAYVLLTHEPDRPLSPAARRRLDSLAALQTLGAGFDLAGRDLDIRGAGALFGEAQSGHLRDIGAEMFERMLAETVEAIRAGREPEEPWTPRIQTGMPVFIPDDYIPDPDERVRTYRRIAAGADPKAQAALAGELERRYGPLPPEVRTLIALGEIKRWCRRHHVAEIDIGPQGITLAFRDGHWPDERRLVAFDLARDDIDYRIGEKLIHRTAGPNPAAQLDAARALMRDVDAAVGWMV